MKSPVIKRSIVIAGHKTSVSLEDAFWTSLKDIADDRNVTLSDLVSSIDTDRQHGNLSSAIRLFVLDHYRNHTMPAREPAVTSAIWMVSSGRISRTLWLFQSRNTRRPLERNEMSNGQYSTVSRRSLPSPL